MKDFRSGDLQIAIFVWQLGCRALKRSKWPRPGCGRQDGEEHSQEWLCHERKSSGMEPACGGQAAATFVRSKLLESAGLVADSNYG